MKKNEELFYLIKSLTKSEKRYFTLNSKGNEDAEYLLLFLAIDAQKKYNEAKIREQFKDKAFITQLTTLKNYLKSRILQSLRNFHSKISIQAELIDILRNIEILFHKGLYTICESELKRAEKKAINFQKDLLLFHIQDWKRKVHQTLHPQDTESLKPIISKQKEILNTTVDYTNLLIANTDPTQTSISKKKTHQIQNKTLKTLHIYKKQLAASTPEKAKQTIEKLLKEWEQKPELLKEYFITYFSASNDYLEDIVWQKSYKEAFVRILLLKQKLNENNSSSASLIKETWRLHNIELKIHRNLTELHNTQEVIEEIEQFANTYNSLIPDHYWASFRFHFASIYFQKNDYHKSLHWTNHILNNQTKDSKKDIITYSHWLNILSLYELKNKNDLKQQIATTKKYIKKQKNIESYENILLRHLSKTIEYSEKEKKNASLELTTQLEKNPIPEFILEQIPFKDWLNLK